MNRPLRLLPPVLSLLVLSAAATPAAAEVRRCVTPSGQTIFTDRKCGDVGATERLPPAAGAAPSRVYRGGCARNLQELVFEITTAIDTRDANRLAGVYHWAGMSGSAGDRFALVTATMRIFPALCGAITGGVPMMPIGT